MLRAQRAGIPVVLGSATPSLESLENAGAGRYQRLDLPQRAAANARMPAVRMIDTRADRPKDGLTQGLLLALREDEEGFATVANLQNIGQRSVALGLVTVGQTLVVLAGSLDLSVAYVVSVAAMVASVSE